VRLLVTRDDYFESAMRILGNEGSSGLKIAPLCRSLNVTSGSFYGYFGSLDGFVGELMDYWEEQQTDRIVRLTQGLGDPTARIHAMKKLAAGLPHEAEAAIRSWAHTNPVVGEAQRRVDTRRVGALTTVLVPAVGSRAEAKRLAMMGITLLVGLQQWRSPVKKKDFDNLFDEYELLVLSRLSEEAAAAVRGAG
jgi:AcrR family transcriptional regulator